ncbi:MAG: hypothetical protein WAK72_27380, partial [Pseudolabrys sp.]
FYSAASIGIFRGGTPAPRPASLLRRKAILEKRGHEQEMARVKTQLTMLRFNGLVNRIGGPTDAGELVLV